MCNGIGASLEILQPFVDPLDPRREVIRFDLPGVGGKPLAGFQIIWQRLVTMLADLTAMHLYRMQIGRPGRAAPGLVRARR